MSSTPPPEGPIVNRTGTMATDSVFTALRDLYQENVNQARHHENQRERMTALAVGIATALVGLISQNKFGVETLLLSVLMIPLGIFGLLWSRKHYERNRLHKTVSDHYLEKIGQHLVSPSSLSLNFLQDIEKAARQDHKENFAIRMHREASATGWRLHVFWNSVHIAITILGIVLSAFITAFHFDTIRNFFYSG